MVIPARAAKLYERTWDRFNEMLSFISTMALGSLCKDSRVNYRGMQEWKEQHGYVEPEQADASKDRASNPIGTSEENPTFLQLNPASLVSVSGVTYCNINPESYLSNFRGQCYLFTLLFLCPLVRKEIPVGFDWSPVRHFSHPVEQVGEIFKEVDAMQPAGTCQ